MRVSKSVVEDFKKLMEYNNDTYQDEPYVGLFWYDPNTNSLTDVVSIPAQDVQFNDNGVKTCRQMHKDIWKKKLYKTGNSRYKKNYTAIPRGRVFEYKDSGFVVMVGSWINDYPEAKQEIIDEFQLPQDTVFQIDSHWDIGKGWDDLYEL